MMNCVRLWVMHALRKQQYTNGLDYSSAAEGTEQSMETPRFSTIQEVQGDDVTQEDHGFPRGADVYIRFTCQIEIFPLLCMYMHCMFISSTEKAATFHINATTPVQN